jgi:hypothetical protein
MGLLSELDEKRLRLARVAKRQAFDCYLRHGQVPAAPERLAEAVASQAKFLDFGLFWRTGGRIWGQFASTTSKRA